MAITDSRNVTGTLTLDGTAFAKQATAVSLVPSFADEGEDVETLDGSKLQAEEVVSWSLNLGLIQDFEDEDGVIEFLRSRSGENVAWSWEPTDGGPTYSGSVLGENTVRIRPTTIGGGVNVRLTSEVELPVKGDPTVTYPV